MKRKHVILAALVFLANFLVNNVVADEANALFTGESETYQVVVTSSLSPLAINRMHQWTVQLTSTATVPDSLLIQITGGMPEHNHGLPTAPRMTKALGNNQYLIEGIKFHMRGLWVMQINILNEGKSEKLSFELTL